MADPYLQADRETQMILEKAARIDFQDWWMAANRFNRHPDDLIGILADPFVAIIQTYGEQAAAAAVDSMILRRSFYDDLTMLPTPTMDEVAEAEQILKSLNWAIWTATENGKLDQRKAEVKLNGVMNRLVLQPWRGTVYKTTFRDRTLYARVPEPGACWFCLMLASRGAVYTRQTVLGVVSEEGKQKLGDRYHDHCRCLGIEVSKAHMDTQLPLVNKELSDLWQQHVGIKTHPGITADKQQEKWKTLITNLKQQAAAKHQPAPEAAVKEKPRRLRIPELDGVKWPTIPGLKYPEYSTNTGISSYGELLPPLDKMPGHVLYGWTPKRIGKKQTDPRLVRTSHTPETNAGHRWDTLRQGASGFPRSWSNQKIVDSVRDTVESPDKINVFENHQGYRHIQVIREVDGVTILAKWRIRPDGTVEPVESWPIHGKDVTMVSGELKKPIPELHEYTRSLSYLTLEEYNARQIK